jgi:predicted RNase H-like nuclease
MEAGGRPVAGIDGCRAGWICISLKPGSEPNLAVFAQMEDLVATLPATTVMAVDMPIGLPDRAGRGGRGPEALVRRLLGERQSSVFTIPSRAAVYAGTDGSSNGTERHAAHRRASIVAHATSDPPRAVSIQAFGLFPKIRELDVLLRRRADLRQRIIESHPEVAFWRLNGERAMSLPKKLRGQINPSGMAERRALLAACGLPAAFLECHPPRGAGEDDFLDAAAVLFIAARYAAGRAVPFPDPPLEDGFGIPVAIWS